MSVVLRLDHGAGRFSLPLGRRARIRDRIADEIERLVDMLDALDALDGEPDDEPGLGWPEGMGMTPAPVAMMAIPFGLAGTCVTHAPIAIMATPPGHGSTDDREDDAGDDREPDDDREPILGWTDAVDQDGADRFGEPWRHDEDEASRQPPVTRPPCTPGRTGA